MTNTEEKWAEIRVARKLEEEGYSIVREPDPTTIPFDLFGYRPDILAMRGDERLIVEVKSRHDPRNLERYKRVAEAISQHPKWRFMISTIADDFESDDAATKFDTGDFDFARVLKKLRSLFDGENFDLAIPFLWNAYIAGMRIVGQRSGIPIDVSMDRSVLNHMYSLGEISNEEYIRAKEYLSLRNELVHRLNVKVTKEQAIEMLDFVTKKLREWELIE